MRAPSLGKQLRNYLKALRRWIKAGRPVRDDREVARILDTVCGQCRHFNEVGSCNVCGCRLAKEGPAFRSKVRMETEKCPKDKW